jgi:hypothetical protein
VSVTCSAWVWKHTKTRGNDKLLLLAIADVADDDGGNAWPSIPTLAAKATCSERTVQRRLVELEEAGCIAVDRGAGKRGTHRYTVLMDDRAAGRVAVPTPVENLWTELGEGVENPDQGVTTCHPDTVTGEVTELCHQGGDTQVSPERPVRPKDPPTPRTAGGDRRPGTTNRRTRCSTTNPVHDRCRGCGTTTRQLAEADRRKAAATPRPPCRLHAGQDATSCRSCAADAKAAAS